MAKVKVISLDGAKNLSIHYPVVGVLHHDSNGVAEVDEEKVEELLSRRKDHLMLDSDYKNLMKQKTAPTKQSVKNQPSRPSKPAIDLEESEEGENTDQKTENQDTKTSEVSFRASLEGETKIALQALCEDYEFPEAEYKDLKKADLIDYIIKKSAAASTEAE